MDAGFCSASNSSEMCGGGGPFDNYSYAHTWGQQAWGRVVRYGDGYADAVKAGWDPAMPGEMWESLQSYNQTTGAVFAAAAARRAEQSKTPTPVVTTSETFRVDLPEDPSRAGAVFAGAATIALAEPTPVGEIALLLALGAYAISTNIFSFDPFASPPGVGWVWKGHPEKGAWHNPDTRESIRPDLNHAPPIGPHVDYRDPNKNDWRIFPDGRREPKSK